MWDIKSCQNSLTLNIVIELTEVWMLECWISPPINATAFLPHTELKPIARLNLEAEDLSVNSLEEAWEGIWRGRAPSICSPACPPLALRPCGSPGYRPPAEPHSHTMGFLWLAICFSLMTSLPHFWPSALPGLHLWFCFLTQIFFAFHLTLIFSVFNLGLLPVLTLCWDKTLDVPFPCVFQLCFLSCLHAPPSL